jgi:hypothetical protein
MRIPFPLLRQTAWLLTFATIAFNGAAAWPDPLGVGMHAVIPILFVITVEAARHAVGRIADITADKHMEGVRLTRWLLSPVPTFKLWRRMKLWELRSYEQVIKLEQHRLVYETQLKARFGRRWRRKAPVEALMPLRLAKYGVPLTQTAPHVLEEAGLSLSVVERTAVEEAEELSDEQPLALDAAVAAVGSHMEIEESGVARRPGTRLEPMPHDVPKAVQAEREALVTEGRSAEQAETGVPEEGSEVVGARDADDVPHPFFEPAVTVPPAPDAKEPAPYVASVPARALAASLAVGHQADEGTSQQVAAETPSVTAQGHEYESVPAAVATAGGAQAGGEAPQQTLLDVPTTTTMETHADDPVVWEASVTDTGEVTARLPEQRPEEPETDDPVQQQIETVSEWLLQAEQAGQKLSGAEVARRLGVSPKTGQRRVIAAAEYLAQKRQQQGRTRLRSVRS